LLLTAGSWRTHPDVHSDRLDGHMPQPSGEGFDLRPAYCGAPPSCRVCIGTWP